MRFARLNCGSDQPPAGLEELARQELDFLQLDYARPRIAPVDGSRLMELPGHAAGICGAMRRLVKPLFLEPGFRVVTSAGWSDAYGCVEQMAGVLVEGGCGEVAMSAVRGSNVLPILDMLAADGIDLSNAEDGTPWQNLRGEVLAADLQIGAAPIATAIAEKARVIVAGYYDGAAPAIAHAVTSHQWSWQDYPLLAAAAVAARVATFRCWSGRPPRGSSTPWSPGHVELDASGRVVVTTAGECPPAELLEWLGSGRENNSQQDGTADVAVEVAKIAASSTSPQQLVLEGANGVKSDGNWRLEILYHTGYSAETLVEFAAESDPSLRQYAGEVARAHLQPGGDTAGLLWVDPLESPGAGGLHWLRLGYQTHSLKACRHFVDRATHLIESLAPQARIVTGPLRVLAQCGLWTARVPRDAVDIAVETRLAKEWL